MEIAILLTFVSAAAVNYGYLREHDAAAMLPELSARMPVRSLRLLLSNRSWLAGFATETIGFLCFVAALALAPLALVQSLAAGGIAVLAFLGARLSGMRLDRREKIGVAVAIVGLALLGVSLRGGAGEGSGGSWIAVALWAAVSAAAAGLSIRLGARRIGSAGYGAAAGLLFATGDVTTETVTRGGSGLVFLPVLFAAYGLGTSVLQLGFQKGGALATAGTATLFSDALPILAGTTVYAEPFPDGSLGLVRGLAFAVLVVGAVALSRQDGMIRPACPNAGMGRSAVPAESVVAVRA